MLWPIVLPFQLTAGFLLAVIALATVVAPAIKWRRLPTFFAAMILCAIAFFPLCATIMNVLDAKRFGVFHYKEFADVDDHRVERYLPSAASKITLDKYAQGFRARFSIKQNELDRYMDELWTRQGAQSVSERGEPMTVSPNDPQTHHYRYGDLGWDCFSDAVEQYSPTASNGAGFSIWYSPSLGIAYQRAGYW